MHDERFEAITGPLVHTYGPIHVYKLMKWLDEDWIGESDEYHLIALLDKQDGVKAAIWHYDSRTELPWVVCAIKRYLSLRKQMIGHKKQQLDIMQQPEHMARRQAYLERFIAERKPTQEALQHLSAERVVANYQYGVDAKQADYDSFADALREVEAMYPEGIQDVSNEADREREQQELRITEGRRKAEVWRSLVGKAMVDYKPYLGAFVLQAGPFRVYQKLGVFERLDVLGGREFAGGINVPYMILFEDDTLGTFDIKEMYSRYVPAALQICRPARTWFAVMSEAIHASMRSLDESSESGEIARLQEALEWQKKLYLRVYDEWLALGCPDAPDDYPDPVFDPTVDLVTGAFGRFPDSR